MYTYDLPNFNQEYIKKKTKRKPITTIEIALVI